MNASSKFIEVQGVEQSFKTAKGLFPALRNIDLTIARGEFVSNLARSAHTRLTTWLLLGAVRSGSLHGPYFLRSSIWMNFGIDGATSKRASGPPVWFAHSGVGGFRLSMNATSATTI